MAMMEETIIGGISGLFVAGLTALGIFKKMDKLEEKAVTKEFCEERHKAVTKMQEDLTYIRDRVDKLFDHVTNNGK